jgi:redox-sensitive bicupin YhaK (pirin superfamily)
MKANESGRRVAQRTRGSRHGSITRLMSPSDLGQILKPFVFLDLFDAEQMNSLGTELHPHSGIATVTYLLQGSIRYEDTEGRTGLVPKGGMEWMKAGGGAWHGGGGGEPGRTRGFQLWIALPRESELEQSESRYLSPESIPNAGSVRILLGRHLAVASTIPPPSPLNYLFVQLAPGERWHYQPPAGHTVGWIAVGAGDIVASEPLHVGDLAAFESSEAPIEVEARSATEFVLGSAVPHPYELALGSHSVHTSQVALRTAESRIAEIRARLIATGRL